VSGLSGLRVLVTGSAPEALCAVLRARGATPLAVPTIAIRPADPAPLDAALGREFDWIVVTSANGARAVLDRLQATGAEVPAATRWAAVGPRTAAALQGGGVAPALVPREGTGAAIAAAMPEVEGRRVLLARGRAAGRDLPTAMRARGALVEDVVAYGTVEGPEASRAALAAALAAGLDAVVFTSGSTVRGLARLAGDPARLLEGAIVVAIGPSTAAVAREAGLAPRVAADRTPRAIVAALEEAAAALARPSAGG